MVETPKKAQDAVGRFSPILIQFWPIMVSGYQRDSLSHLPLDKMAAILADNIFEWIFWNENGRIPIQISLNFVSESPIDNNPSLVQIMAWHRTGDKPLSEPMLTQFTDAYRRH